MNLDKKIINGKTYLDCFDVEEAKQFIGKRGYFANCNGAYEDLDLVSTCYKLVYASLKEVDEQKLTPFTSEFCEDFYFFLPEEWVKQPEKKYRPFTLEEFQDRFEIGNVIRFRRKGDDREHRLMLVGYIPYLVYDGSWILLGDIRFSPEILFKDYELYDSGKYVPFGIEE